MSNGMTEQGLMQRAIDSSNLLVRSQGNACYGTMDFDAWVDQLLEKISFSRVLDVCCGTGNQLVKYAVRPGVKSVIGVDISPDALTNAKGKLLSLPVTPLFSLVCLPMEEMFNGDLKDASFDLVSCFYGLYYAKNIEFVIEEMVNHLDRHGTMIIVGPYGDNNFQLFTILQRYFKLPELVTRSSTSFMENELFPLLEKNMLVTREMFVNYINYPSPESVLEYWRSTTFYSPEHDAQVSAAVTQHFQNHEAFVLEKHIMAYVAKRRL